MNNPTSCQINVKSCVVFHPKTFTTAQMWRIVFAVKMTAPAGYTPTITSGVEGRHASNSFHYIGGAIDWRIRDFTPSDVPRWVREITKKLGPDYFVLLEANHLHIHWRKMER